MIRSDTGLKRVVLFVALANLAYFAIEFSIALSIGSVSLFADSIDFLEDASVNLLIVAALGWPLERRSRVGMAMAALLLVPGLATVWSIVDKLATPIPPAPIPLSATGAGALVVNLGCALLLARYRHHRGSLAKAAFLSARNDALANIGIILGGGLTLWTASAWPDLVIGLAVAAMNADAAREVWQAARSERLGAEDADP